MKFHHFYTSLSPSPSPPPPPTTKGQLTNCDFKIVGTPPFYLPSTSKTFSSTANNLKLQSVKYAVHNYLFTKKTKAKKIFFANLYVYKLPIVCILNCLVNQKRNKAA